MPARAGAHAILVRFHPLHVCQAAKQKGDCRSPKGHGKLGRECCFIRRHVRPIPRAAFYPACAKCHACGAMKHHMSVVSTLLVRAAHLQSENCPPKKLVPERKAKRRVKRKVWKHPRRPRKMVSPVQLPKSFSLATFHSFAPAISNTISSTILNNFHNKNLQRRPR